MAGNTLAFSSLAASKFSLSSSPDEENTTTWCEFEGEMILLVSPANSIRRLFRLTVKKNGRFAKLPVGATIETVLDEIDGLTIEKDPLDPDEENGHEADPSHALIRGTPDPTIDSELAETVGDMIAACVTELHPATIEQVELNLCKNTKARNVRVT